MQEVKIDLLRQNYPQFYYKRLDLNAVAVGHFIIPIDIGYAFLLRTVKTKWPVLDGQSVIDFKTEFIQQVAGRPLQNEPFNFSLISTPNNSGRTQDGTGAAFTGVREVVAPNPVDATAFNINFSANPVKSNIILNYFYQRREDLQLKISFTPTVLSESGYVDILFCGYLIPDFTQKEWD